MDTTTPRTKRGGYKRSHIKKPLVKKPWLHSYAIRPDLFTGIELTPAAPQFTLSPPITPAPQPEKSIGELIFEFGWEVGKSIWKETAPVSYNTNQAMFALAPYWPPEGRWLLGIGAVGTAIYGLVQVADRFEKATKRGHKQR